ncbi:DNA primase [Candidatus Peregrinibacteria bacterium]|jgi:DNA primase|nr:DNA primase [Candidatus Peregrinibacteria bacterium]MBT3598645.1 DNA primase [Candidatus Peregrinibacteria bacterium]MBT4585753.1 DNA primase [Candidatus Peregrinibacteria bacterium]MBT6730956.1 DNA primase [Candidatus Peregrinibacteria bacterium]MBT7009903.1 DNA primase [Candidatus Peregrinibacteria bacterium]
MDPVEEIKSRLPIEELIGQYCQLQKKGRNFVCLCPFHNDTHPSFTVSPDKGIGYCFACNSGGDIFSFYQQVENVDFRQALKDLAEKAGVELPEVSKESVVKKDEKDRLRECLEATKDFYADSLKNNEVAKKYLEERGIPQEQIELFGIGVSPDSFSETYNHLLKKGFSKSEILKAGISVQKDLSEERMYDRFRNRLMFPIFDAQGKIVGFGGRTLGDDDAKYINSSEGPLYRKSNILYGLNFAKEAIRSAKSIVMVEGYFDVLACHRVGIKNVVAVSGTALTQEHVHILKRNAETVVLCLDQDRAGKEAAQRAFILCSPEELHVHTVQVPDKDPDETATRDPKLLNQLLSSGGVPYLDKLANDLLEKDLNSIQGKREAMELIVPLLNSIGSSVEREHYINKFASVLSTTNVVLKEDLSRLEKQKIKTPINKSEDNELEDARKKQFSKLEVSLGLFCTYPKHLGLLDQLIPPDDGMPSRLYAALKDFSGGYETLSPKTLDITDEDRERLSILLLYCEESDLSAWSEILSAQEIKRNCQASNREFLQKKQKDIAKKLLIARTQGNSEEETRLSAEYQQIVKLSRLTR